MWLDGQCHLRPCCNGLLGNKLEGNVEIMHPYKLNLSNREFLYIFDLVLLIIVHYLMLWRK